MNHDRAHLRRRQLGVTVAVVGALVCAYLELVHVQTYLGLGSTAYCDAGEHISCTSVALSGASVVLGIPTPIWGFAGFVALGLATARRSRLWLPLAGFAALASVAFFVYAVFIVGSICVLCEVVHVLCFVSFGLAWRGREPVESSWVASLEPRSAAVELGIPAALLVLAAVAVPAYWMSASWSSGPRLPHGFDEDGRPWLGSEDPELVVHEYVDYACPHCRIASARMKMRLGQDDGLRVVRHHQPRMRCAETPGAKPSERCLQARAAICAGDQDRFWEMDDWLFHHASGTTELSLDEAAADVGLDRGLLEACLVQPSTYERAQADVDEAGRWGIRGTPGYVVDGRRIEQDELRQLLGAR